MFGRRRWRRREWFGNGRQQRAFLGEPHPHRERQTTRLPREQAGVCLGDQIERRGAVADRPGERATEGTGCGTVDEHPCGVVDNQRSAVRERTRLDIEWTTTVVSGDERAQLDSEKTAVAIGVVGIGHGPRR